MAGIAYENNILVFEAITATMTLILLPRQLGLVAELTRLDHDHSQYSMNHFKTF